MVATYQFHTLAREQQYEDLKGKLREIALRRKNDGKSILKYLWDIYAGKYWEIEEGFEGPGGWKQYVDEVVAVPFEGDEYFDDFPPMCSTVLHYVHERASTNPLYTPQGELITAELLIDLPKWTLKLKTMTQKWYAAKTDEDREKLVMSGFLGTNEHVRTTGEAMQKQITPLILHYVIQVNGDGTQSFVFSNLSSEAAIMLQRQLERSFGSNALEIHLA